MKNSLAGVNKLFAQAEESANLKIGELKWLRSRKKKNEESGQAYDTDGTPSNGPTWESKKEKLKE